jgi:hypothetical protein
LLSATSHPAGAQGISMWAGMGSSSQVGSAEFGKQARQLGIQLGLPVIPIALRADALLLGSGLNTDAVSYIVSAVVQLRFPVVEPYALIGRGKYARSPTSKVEGFNVGAGARAGIGRLGFFAEIRRHDVIGRTVTLAGVTF